MAKSRDFFVWTDDEVELLLHVTLGYKAAMALRNSDWESLHSKYGDIHERYMGSYPAAEDAERAGKDFPHPRNELTKGQLTTKLKNIRTKYRKAVDSGRKRGHGRVILLFFDLCENLWGGFPASQAIDSGLETGDLEAVESSASSLDAGSPSVSREGTVASAEPLASCQQRLTSTHSLHRKARPKRKPPMESADQDDLNFKRRLLQVLEASDQTFVQTMDRLSSTMDRLNDNIEQLVQHICSGTAPQMPPQRESPNMEIKSEPPED